MAKRKAARSTGRKAAGKKAKASRKGARKAAPRRRSGQVAKKRGARKAARRSSGQVAKKRVKATARKAAFRKAASRKAAPARTTPAKSVKAAATTAPRRTAAQAAPASAKAPARSRRSALREGGRKAPALDRQRRIVTDEDLLPSPPSSLDLDRTASAVRSGRHGLSEKFKEHTETSPALTAGDVDADWESAYSVGDEAPGGDNPTPDQDIVDDIGKALGVVYEDNEELKGEKKISDRDKKRWELDPASSDDYGDR